jgi:hypothetical protein
MNRPYIYLCIVKKDLPLPASDFSDRRLAAGDQRKKLDFNFFILYI